MSKKQLLCIVLFVCTLLGYTQNNSPNKTSRPATIYEPDPFPPTEGPGDPGGPWLPPFPTDPVDPFPLDPVDPVDPVDPGNGSGGAVSPSNLNYIITTIYKVATTTALSSPIPQQAQTTITYFDGLGRPIQQIANRQSPSSKDIMTHIEYDPFGRQVKEYLPYESTSTDMAFDPNAQTATLNYYNTGKYDNTANPFSEKKLEASPLNRVLKQAAPGTPWAMNNGHEIKFDYQTNATNEVRYFKATTTWDATQGLYDISFSDEGFYAENELYKNVTYDENTTASPSESSGSVIEFKNKEGQLILKRTYESGIKHDTYYVYDIYGNLTYVLPPKADGIITVAVLNGLCYQYKYDYRNRMVEKKLPGKQWEFIVYNKLNKVVATGPAFSPFQNQTAQGWLITKYDVFGRPVYTGWSSQVSNAAARKILQDTQNAATVLFETRQNSTIDGVSVGYSNNIEPVNFNLLTVTYYDTYGFPQAQTLPTTIEGQTVLANNKTLTTGTWVRALSTATAAAGETTTLFYDEKARVIETHLQNHLGGYTNTDTKLDFSGKVIYTITKHKRTSGNVETIVREEFTYSPQDRLLTHTHQVNGGTVELLVDNNKYDALGQLESKKVGNTTANPLQIIDFKYNIRGWLTEINKTANLQQGSDPVDLFAFKINYNDLSVGSPALPLYNGNIAETFWKTGSDNLERGYGYAYDNLNRLKNAMYQKNGLITNAYNESLTYDKNGNILSLFRNGDYDQQVGTIGIDDLAYSYPANSNQLFKVTDNSNNPSGFKDGNINGDDYSYDDNGNMIVDKNKDITNITYNHLNLPKQITFATGNIEYIYNAAGQKLEKIVTENGVSTTTDYLGGYQYKNNVLEFFQTAEGYFDDINKKYVYQYKDHLGNVRVSYAKNPQTQVLEIIEENNYYPFGLKHKGYNGNITSTNAGQKYKYNGKELQDELGLAMYDYGARNYDPALGRWMNIDPLAEKMRRWSPYNYCFDNPIHFVDPDGMGPLDWIKNNTTGKYVWSNSVNNASQTPQGYSYVGKTDNSIIKDIGWNFKGNAVTTTKMGHIASDSETSGAVSYGVSHLTTVSATTRFTVSADVSSNLNLSTGEFTKQFNGVSINVSVVGTATGTDNVAVTGMASTNFGGESYAIGLQAPDGSKPLVQETGTTSVSGSILISAGEIASEPGVKVFPSINVSGNWQNVKQDGSGASPVSAFGITPRTYNHTYPASSPTVN